MIALDAANGDPVWELDLGVRAIDSSPAVANGFLFIGSPEAEIVAIQDPT